MDHSIVGRQVAAARAFVGLTQAELAKKAKISVPTLKRMEASDGPASGLTNNVAAVRAALEKAGVEFTNGEQPGIRLKKLSETVADLTRQIDIRQTEITPESDHEKPSPNRAMKQLRRAHDQNELAVLKNRRARLAKPKAKRKPK
ncbi:MAG: helix-turn-helix domain-containing protein [Methylocella sp.]